MASVITVVDDDPSVMRALQRLLRSAGFDVQLFGSAEDFLLYGNFRASDCLILDIHLTGMSGLDLLLQLRSAGVKIPVLLITAHDDPHAREQATELGAQAFLCKPLDPSVFLDSVRKAISPDIAGQQQPRPCGWPPPACAPVPCAPRLFGVVGSGRI